MTTNQEKLFPDVIWASKTRIGEHGIYGSWTTNEHPTDFQGKIRVKNRKRTKYIHAEIAEELAEALRYYANKVAYEFVNDSMTSFMPIELDTGDSARQALQKYEGMKGRGDDSRA